LRVVIITVRLSVCRQTNKWLLMYRGLNESLKELGDVKNWAQTIEVDSHIVIVSPPTQARV
jgi:hypothetical protein